MATWNTLKYFLSGICVGIAVALSHYRCERGAIVWFVLSLIPMLPFQSLARHNKDGREKEADRRDVSGA